jgi:hypothetical protein
MQKRAGIANGALQREEQERILQSKQNTKVVLLIPT